MRNFQLAPKETQERLAKLFPDLIPVFELEGATQYKHVSISVFDHWLTREETPAEIDNVEKEKEESNDEKLYKFCLDLADSTECYLIKLRGRKKDKVTFRDFTNDAAKQHILKPQRYNWGDKWRFVLALPEYEAVYFEGSDFTHHLYYKDKNKLNGLTRLIKNGGLHLLCRDSTDIECS